MDAPASITIRFLDITETRIILRDDIFKLFPNSCIALYIKDVDPNIIEYTVTDYNPEEWDMCILIAKGTVLLYLCSTYMRDIYQKYFGGSCVDNIYNSLVKQQGIICQDFQEFISGRTNIVCIPTIGLYNELKKLCTSYEYMPFQMIRTANQSLLVCLDNGIPMLSSKTTNLRQARMRAIAGLRSQNITNTSPDHHKLTISGAEPGIALPAYRVWGITASRNYLPPESCNSGCIIDNEDVEIKCQCHNLPTVFGQHAPPQAPFQCSNLISLDEIKFIHSMFELACGLQYIYLTELIDMIPHPHSHEEYFTALNILDNFNLPKERAIMERWLHDGNCVSLYLGIVCLPK